MNSRKVYIPQLPTRWDVATQQRVPSIDTNPATVFGELVTVFGPDVSKEDAIAQLRAVGPPSIGPADYILAAGDVVMLVMLVMGAINRNGRATLLRWDGESKTYRTEEITEWQKI